MDTYVKIIWYGDDQAAAVDAAFSGMRQVERRMSAHLPTSEVAAITAAAGQHAVVVSDDTFQVVRLALTVAELTNGAFDPTVQPLVALWADPVPSASAIDERLARVGYQRVRLNEATREVELLQLGMGLDLGGIAKGFAVDRAADILRQGGVTRALIDAGGDLYGLGQRGDDRPWRVAVQHPRRPDDYLAVLSLTEAAVVTSGDYQRYIEVEGVRYHHILDPRTGWPARAGLIAVTVLADSSAWADGLSTALFVLGTEAALELVEALEGVEALLVGDGGTILTSSGLKEQLELRGW